ncbi:hypothetical protein FRACYDRAFT_245968 [Fragilariopsis cylindrus CCMP1102]|uniref:Uncharacterized protein n=1 Tax=Fragilariopsis cylindrus CCMP1102 TaxID=635003 RepID=A0A1E7EZI9_9STRA|nr:hypothetical protein FRACYDRAFT_245968 [Fragilariopsis cylindrus CCMP1102]|eukprot:OEU11418.1 hypothetical protein FRACYDRAFT_245968 [Fragilariopsis cylindrus CCMP1102]
MKQEETKEMSDPLTVQHDKVFAAAFGGIPIGDGTDTDVGGGHSDAATIGTATTDAFTDGSSTLLPIASSMSKTPKKKKITTKDRHQSNLRFMHHIHGHVWTNNVMFAIIPDHIVGYCKLALLFLVKKGISFLHPEKDTDWNIHNKTGNPTRYVVVRNLMKKGNDQEIAGNGAASEEQGPFVKEEFEQTIHMLEANDNFEESGKTSMLYCVLIGSAVWLKYVIIYRGDAIESEFVYAFLGSNDEEMQLSEKSI